MGMVRSFEGVPPEVCTRCVIFSDLKLPPSTGKKKNEFSGLKRLKNTNPKMVLTLLCQVN